MELMQQIKYLYFKFQPSTFNKFYTEMVDGESWMTVTMALGLKYEEDDTMSDYSSMSEGQIEEDAEFSQAMVGEPLSPAKTTKQEKLTCQKSRAASQSNTNVARKIFDNYLLDPGSPYYHGLCKEMMVPFALRYGMDTHGRQEILLAMERN